MMYLCTTWMLTQGIVDDDDDDGDDCDDVTIYSCGQNVRAITCNAYMIQHPPSPITSLMRECSLYCSKNRVINIVY